MAKQRILVVDDNLSFVEASVAALQDEGLTVQGCDKPEEILSWRSDSQFAFDLILLDMRLGTTDTGSVLNAAVLLPHLRTYAPKSRVVVFSQSDITVEECVRCIRLGALSVIPKGATAAELALVANVYDAIGNADISREQLIRVLWDDISTSRTGGNGRRLEMLAINLFGSMPTFSVVGNNVQNAAFGEIDVLVQNVSTHPFWVTLNSLQIVLECKHRQTKPTPAEFDHLKSLVRSRGALSKIGIFVTTSSVTSNHSTRAATTRSVEDVYIYYIDSTHLQKLVELSPVEREPYIREVFSAQ
jgi:CheY-like chemotaxis protein